MSKIRSQEVISGTFGTVWVNDEEWLHVTKFEAKVTGEFEDINMAGKLTTGKKFMGWTGEGTITVNKVNSTVTKMLAENFKKGIMPEIKIVGKLADPQARGTERVEILEVTFSEFMLLNFEVKAKMEEEVPFSFEDYNLIDAI
ncbi:phage tail tube protein [uncultured Tyzzerella sp.]|uniref:phage tail tube protein n=1 Tax=uncultured Tyzzerella sp. TaxID=2321398 RepID=UPI0029433942|nr:phage tail tube protein [uncultured Tyzzerella sp.]